MSKDLEQNIARMKAELAEMERKLEQSKKFEFQGGAWMVTIDDDGIDISRDNIVVSTELPFRTETKEAGVRLKNHIKNQIILWQVAEFVNDGWVRPKGSCSAYEVFLDDSTFEWESGCYTHNAIFKDKKTAQRACDILNEQADELGWVK